MLWLWLLGCPVAGESFQSSIRDQDGDGFDAVSFGGQDCDDDDSSVNPLAEEVWYDGIDQDCDGNDSDRDGDGFAIDQDCDDDDADVFPDAPGEVWYDGIDQDCDGNDGDQDGDGLDSVDVGGADCDDLDPDVGSTRWYYVDLDGDGHGDQYSARDLEGGCTAGPGLSDVDDDCDDQDASIHPEATEVCDEADRDEDCDGVTEDDDPDALGKTIWYIDVDGDGFGDPGAEEERCDAAENEMRPGEPLHVRDDTDCNDDDADAHPGAEWTYDADGDDFGAEGLEPVAQCERIENHAARGGDCDDRDPLVNPGMEDAAYDLVDADCQGGTESDGNSDGYPDPVPWWSDVDVDGDGSADPSPRWSAQLGGVECPTTTDVFHVGLLQPYSSPEAALMDAGPCDTIVLHEGTYNPFVVEPGQEDKDGLVIVGAEGEEVVIDGSLGTSVTVDATGVTLSNLTFTSGGTALLLDQPAYLERLTFADNVTGIESTSALLAYDLWIEDAARGLDHPGGPGPVLVTESTFVDLFTLLGSANLVVVDPTAGDGLEGEDVLFQRIHLEDCTAVEEILSVGALLDVTADVVTMTGVTFSDGQGSSIRVAADIVDLNRTTILDGSTSHQQIWLEPRNVNTSSRATVVDTWIQGGEWSPSAELSGLERSFVVASQFEDTEWHQTVIRDVAADSTTDARWLASTSIRSGASTLVSNLLLLGGGSPDGSEHVPGVGVWANRATLQQVTIVGFEYAMWLSDGLDGTISDLTDSILWGNESLMYPATGPDALLESDPSFMDVASDDTSCAACAHEDPQFLRYDPGLPPSLWDLHLQRTSPHYDVEGGSVLATCASQGSALDAVSGQLGAFGAHGAQPVEDLLHMASSYEDCDGDGLYDAWERSFRQWVPTADPDMDGLTNLEEFLTGTIPTRSDTDGDSSQDGADNAPLDPESI